MTDSGTVGPAGTGLGVRSPSHHAASGWLPACRAQDRDGGGCPVVELLLLLLQRFSCLPQTMRLNS